MEEWKEVRLGDYIQFQNGYAFKSSDFQERGKYKIVKIKELKDGGVKFFSDTACIDIQDFSEYEKYSIENDDVLFALTGDPVSKPNPLSWVGRVSIYKRSEKALLNQRTCKIIKSDKIDNKFLYYYFRQWENFYALASKATGSASQANISTTTIADTIINLPPLPTQQKIAAILSSLDDKIELNNKINENLEQQAQEIYKNICQNAETRKFEDLISSIETGTRPKGGAELSGIPSIGAEKIEGLGKYDYSNEKYISLEFFSKMKRGIVLSKDVLLYKDGAYTGKSSMALNGFPHKECAVNEHVFILRTKDNYAQFFLYCTLKNPDIHKSIYNLACGKAAQPGLNQQELLTVNIPLPAKENIEKFEETVSPLMNNIAENALENRNLATIRDTLLPKLMNGEIDS